MNERIELHGLTFAVTCEPDDRDAAPWVNDDCHGPVSDWTARDKLPGERVLNLDGRSRRYYDVQEAMRIAKRDNWGMSAEWIANYTASNNGIAPSAGAIRVAAVDADFSRLRAWCAGDWSYVGVVVTLLDVDGARTEETASLWGVESDAGEYLDVVAQDLAEEIAARIGDAKTLLKTTVVRN